MENILQNPAVLWLLVGIILIFLEVAVTGVIGLLFLSLAAVTLGILMSIGFIESDSVIIQISYFFLFTFIWVVVLWRPFQKMKNKGSGHNDYVGTFATVIEEDLKKRKVGYVKWSGVKMRAKIAPECKKDVLEKDKEFFVHGIKSGVLLISDEEVEKKDAKN